jgi:cellulase/cellobiase CelA1
VVTNSWPAGDGSTAFQAQLEVTAGSSGVQGWAVSWQLPAGQQITAVWNAQLGTSGSTVTAENMSYNGTLRSGEKAVFGLQGKGPDAVARNGAQLTCTRTR